MYDERIGGVAVPRSSNRYQHETSPRKLEPDYTPVKNPKTPKKGAAKKKASSKKKKIEELKIKKRRTVAYILIGFVILFAIGYQNSQIDETFTRIQSLRHEVSSLERESTQLEIAIASSTNLRNIEDQARELLGMQKLNSNQIIYVELPKSDHIEPASEVVLVENTPMFRRIITGIANIFR